MEGEGRHCSLREPNPQFPHYAWADPTQYDLLIISPLGVKMCGSLGRLFLLAREQRMRKGV